MKIHEYQSRELLEKFGVPVPGGIVVDNADQAAEAFDKLAADGTTLAVVKAQVHAGGRGKGGGVKLVKSADEAKDAAATILSKPLVTPQTGPEGVPVNKLLIASGVDIEKEYYLGIVVDRAQGCPVLMGSAEGGMDIEEVAATTPEKIIKEPIDPVAGLQPYQARKVAFAMGFKGKQVGQAVKVMGALTKLFLGTDASLVEINPLIVTPASEEHPDGQVLAIDAKIDFDDNAMFRHKDIKALEDPAEVDPAEAKAAEYGLSYINLDGNIGCLVNGAGLAMATMDIIKLHGGEPANFLDVGGSASEEAVTEAFRIILADDGVKGILVNIFGGIAKCDTIANAIVAAAKQVGFSVPLVVRLEGTNVEPARVILENAKADIPTMIVGSDLTDAAQKITAAIAA
ncbi:ADP-forming succinate--CoA ligase subunit beta [Algisphaera agarilytica]|uniref:Succinate--CoA ligase [ADP-forming] subunit beta n=1 Tax=Algisphaera agarilytica TaxID=1385975 RepID=A0A7X0H675_9BACT|nr:ADP-forming succinate--CoA ligase subunit beta [Algisphaera agarilytica]MBB6428529.1 succinyl-CoA synthetase beta subunit [Algisphaera agarilytica]